MVLRGFSRKSNEDEFSRKSNGGWIFLGIKRGLQKKIMYLRGLRVAEENRAFLGILEDNFRKADVRFLYLVERENKGNKS